MRLLHVCALLLVISGCAPRTDAPVFEQECCTIVAHALGSIDGNPYTNSDDALRANYAIGRRIFEADLDLTADGHWVASHDWAYWKSLTSHDGAIPPSLEAFMSMPIRPPRVSWSITGEYRPISLEGIEQFLIDHPDAVVVTDVKQRFDLLVPRILASRAKSQFVLQAYSFENVDLVVSKDPSARIILTLYQMGIPHGVYAEIERRKDRLQAITVPVSWAAREGVLESLRRTGLPVFVHGAPANINSKQLQASMRERGVSGFYLD